MAKIRVYELAKELEVESKAIIELLAKDNIEVKSQSGLEEDISNKVRNVLGKKVSKASEDKIDTETKKENKEEAPKKQEPKKVRPKAQGKDGSQSKKEGAEAPKKKKKTVVFNLGNSSSGNRRPRNDGRRPHGQGPRNEARRGPIRVREGVEAPSVIRARKEAEEAKRIERESVNNTTNEERKPQNRTDNKGARNDNKPKRVARPERPNVFKDNNSSKVHGSIISIILLAFLIAIGLNIAFPPTVKDEIKAAKTTLIKV